MVVHGLFGCADVTRLDRGKDRPVFAERKLFGTGNADQFAVEFGEPAHQRLAEAGEDRVSGHLRNLAVKAHVTLQEAVEVGQAGALFLMPHFKGSNVVFGRPLDSQPHHVDLEQKPGLLQFGQALFGGAQDAAGRHRHGGQEVGESRGCNPRPFALHQPQEAHAGHVLQGFAHGGSPDAVAFGQVTLGWKLVAGQKPVFLDHADQAVHHLLIEAAAFNGFQCGSVHPCCLPVACRPCPLKDGVTAFTSNL